MAKVVYASLKGPKAKPGKARAEKPVASKTVTGPDGARRTLYTVDADSPTFSKDLTAVFKRNVAKARRENKGL